MCCLDALGIFLYFVAMCVGGGGGVGVGVRGGVGAGCGEEGHPKKLVVPLPHYFLVLFPLQSCRYLPTWC